MDDSVTVIDRPSPSKFAIGAFQFATITTDIGKLSYLPVYRPVSLGVLFCSTPSARTSIETFLITSINLIT